jgi:hypothetical protein
MEQLPLFSGGERDKEAARADEETGEMVGKKAEERVRTGAGEEVGEGDGKEEEGEGEGDVNGDEGEEGEMTVEQWSMWAAQLTEQLQVH